MDRRRFLAGLAGLPVVGGFAGCAGKPKALTRKGEFVRVSPRDSRYFELSDGKPFLPIGLNISFPRFLYDEEAVLTLMEERFRKLAANGGNLSTIWMGHEFYDVEHAHSGRFDPFKVRRIERVVESARQHGIRLKLVFEHFRTLEETALPFRGAPDFSKPVHHVSRGGPAKNMTEYFTSRKCRDRFKKKIRWIGAHLHDKHTVFAWEPWSEIDKVAGGGWMDWTREMLGELHKQFPRNLAAQGLSSLDRFGKSALYRNIWGIKENDFVDVHRFIDPGAQMESSKGPTDVMAAGAVRDALAMKLNKPVLLGATGAVEANYSGPSRLYERDRLGLILHDVLFAPFFAGAAGAGQSWHWNVYVERHDLWRHFSYFAEFVKGIDPPAERFRPGEMKHPRLRVYTLRGGKTFLAWCRDTASGWKQELELGRAAEPVKGAVIEFSAIGGPPAGATRIFDPWIGKWKPAEIRDGKLELGDFLRSVAVRVDG